MRTFNNKGKRPSGGARRGTDGRDKRNFKSEGASREERGGEQRERKDSGNFGKERKSFSGNRTGNKRPSFSNTEDQPKRYNKERPSFSKDRGDKKNTRSDDKSFSKEKRGFGDRGDKKRFSRNTDGFSKEKKGFSSFEEKPKRYKKEGQTVDNPGYFKNKAHSDSEQWSDNDFERSKKGKAERTFKSSREQKEKNEKGLESNDKSPFTDKKNSDRREFIERREKSRSNFEDKNDRVKRKRSDKPLKQKNENGETMIRLNKFIANSGVCSRREADKLIESGAVTVNGKIISELGYRVNPTDVVNYGGAAIKREKNVYVLLNKPKDYITTLDDPEGRKTVMELVNNACQERIYPVGRLDRNTTGLLLFTNDGDMTMKLTHPKNNVQKLYGVEIDKSIRPEDFKAILDGFELEDGFIQADKLEFIGGSTNRKELGIEIHSGKNRIVRRIFEHLGYKVVKLDRVMFAGLTKKDLPRGRWRFLTEKEISFLRMKK